LTTVDPTLPQPPAALRAIVVDDETELAPYLAQWDALAVASERPFCAPGWMLAWWREGRSGKTALRVVLLLDGDRLIGAGPFFAQISYGLTELRLLGAGFSHRIGPLAQEGEEGRVASAMAEALAALKPRPASVVFEGIDAEDPWPELLADAWPGRPPRLRTDSVMEAPVIRLDGSDADWLERRTRNFRKLARRTSRRLDETDVASRIGADEAAVKGFLQLHRLRWEERGGSNLDSSAERVVAAAAAELGEKGRLEVVLLEGPDGPISAELMLRTGPVAAIWATGFDPAWSQYAPGLQVRLVTLRAAAEHGVQLVDLGGGGDEYKVRMADGDMPIAWRTLFPRGLRYPLISLRLAPKRIRGRLRRAADRLPEHQRERLVRLLRRG
jgi:CelD/BcsL family acetyltransferase involved in cellulose biosynthesis